MKILIINVHSSYNAGDAALTQATINQLSSQFPESSIKLLMNDPQSYTGDEQALESFLSWVNKAGKASLLRLGWLVLISSVTALSHRYLGKSIYLPWNEELNSRIKLFMDADMVVSTSGGYLYSYGKGRALLTLLYTMALAILVGKPLYLFPQSYGPFQYNYETKLARIILSRARAVMAREPISYQFLEKLGVPRTKCHLVPDIAFAYEPAPLGEALEWFRKHSIQLDMDRPLLGVTAIDWQSQYGDFTNQTEYEIALATTLRKFISEFKGKVIIFPQCWGPTEVEDDRIPAGRLFDLVGELKSAITVVDSPIPPALLKSLYGQMDFFVGTRMHSNIFALSQNVPVIAIGYLHKTRGIANALGIEDWVIDIKDVNADNLSNLVDELMLNRERYRDYLNKKMDKVIKQSLQAGEIVYRDYKILEGIAING